ncbi:MAG: TetR/AcrR family transcriptional regulator [Caldilineaceae bacterium]
MSVQLSNDCRYVATRQKILDQAYRIVVEKGIDQLSMRSIATAVHSSPANLYEYFTGKDEIVYELHTRLFDVLAKQLETVDQKLAPADYLEQLGIAYLQFVQEHSVLLKLQSHYNMDPWLNSPSVTSRNGPNGNHHRHDRTKPLFDVLQRAIQRYYAAPTQSDEMSAGAIEDRTVAYWSMLHGYAILMGLTGQLELTIRRWRRLVHQFLA